MKYRRGWLMEKTGWLSELRDIADVYLENEEAFKAMLRRGELAPYEGQHVIISKGKVVASGTERNALLANYRKAFRQFEDEYFYVGFVGAAAAPSLQEASR